MSKILFYVLFITISLAIFAGMIFAYAIHNDVPINTGFVIFSGAVGWMILSIVCMAGFKKAFDKHKQPEVVGCFNCKKGQQIICTEKKCDGYNKWEYRGYL